MRKILAFIASGVIPTFVPVCVLLTLPVCMAQKYIPQDMQNSLSYGISFFKLVLNPHIETPSTTAYAIDSIPVVESTVTNMTFAEEAECDEMQAEKDVISPVAVAVINKAEFVQVAVDLPRINVELREGLHRAQSEMKQLEFMRDVKIAVPAEQFEIAFEHALQNMKARAHHVEQIRKNSQKLPRIHIRKKAQVPA